MKGVAFENVLMKEALRMGWVTIDIPDGARQVSSTKFIRCRSPFDFVFLKNGKALFCDAKCTKEKVFKYSNITEHQAKLLKQIHQHGFASGYIVNFIEQNITVYFNGRQINPLQNGSLKPENGILVGTNFIVNFERIFTSDTDKTLVYEPSS